MKNSTPPIDMLRKCRAHFAQCAIYYREKALQASTVAERDDAASDAVINERYVGQIDATLRDWE